MRAAPTSNARSSTGCSSSPSSARCSRTRTGSTRRSGRSDLGEAAIGQVDTGSFMLKLALLGGARGIAANVLWTRAEELKREQDWDRMKATVDLITKLQPHFLSVWTFQGWNLAYNVSVEWDAPEDKYEWIKKGIKFLQDGVKKNRKSPDLIWDTAWTYYHKIGFSDEAIILRRLFRDDDDEEFKTYVDPETDIQVVRQRQLPARLRLVQPLGRPGRRGRAAARQRGRGEPRLRRPVAPAQGAARRPRLPLDARPRPDPLRRRPGEDEHARHPRHLRRGRQERVGQGARTSGSSSASYAFMTPQRDPRDGKCVTSRSGSTTRPTPRRYATLTENQQYWTNRWADQMNYRYWKDRCAAEMTDEGVQARQLFYEGTIAYKTADFDKAVEKFRDGLDDLGEAAQGPQGLPQRRLQQEGHRPDRQALRPGAPAARRARAQGHPVQGAARRAPSRTPPSTRSTPSRCSAHPTSRARQRPEAAGRGRRAEPGGRSRPDRASPGRLPAPGPLAPGPRPTAYDLRSEATSGRDGRPDRRVASPGTDRPHP